MNDLAINIYTIKNNTCFREVEVELPTWKRISRLFIALVATLPLIGLCFKTIRDYWVQVWMGKETILQEITPVKEAPKPILVKEKKPNAPQKHVRFDLPEEAPVAEPAPLVQAPKIEVEKSDNLEKKLVSFSPVKIDTLPPENSWIKEGWPTAVYASTTTGIFFVWMNILKELSIDTFSSPHSVLLVTSPGILAAVLYATHNLKDKDWSTFDSTLLAIGGGQFPVNVLAAAGMVNSVFSSSLAYCLSSAAIGLVTKPLLSRLYKQLN